MSHASPDVVKSEWECQERVARLSEDMHDAEQRIFAFVESHFWQHRPEVGHPVSIGSGLSTLEAKSGMVSVFIAAEEQQATT